MIPTAASTILKALLVLFFAVLSVGCHQTSHQNPQVKIITSFGDIEIELYPGKAPQTVSAFLSYVDAGYYNPSAFYRVVMLEGLSASANVGLIQGGIWEGKSNAPENIAGITHESTKQTGLTHTSGTISLARTKPGTANTEFFICIGDQTQFDAGNSTGDDEAGFAAFGKVTKGMPVVRKIQEQAKNGDRFSPQIVIEKMVRM